MSRIVQYFTDAPNNYMPAYKTSEQGGVGPQDRWLAQSFLTVSAYTISGVVLNLFQAAIAPAQTLTVSIRAVSENAPTGSDLAVGTLDARDLSLNPAGEWKEITFATPYALSEATKYAIVIRCTGIDGAIYWAGRDDGAYQGQVVRGLLIFNANQSVSWTSIEQGNYDFNFATLADAVDVEKISPMHNSVVSTGATTILDWEDPGSGATKYSWVLSWEDPIWGPSTASGTRTAPTTEVDVSSAISSIYDTGARECTWHVRPYIGGEYVDDDDPWTLEIVGPPATAINPTPSDTDTSIAMAPLLTWELDGPLDDDDYFFIYLNTDISKMSTAAGLQVGWRTTLNLQILSGLVANTTYYWQVHVANTQGWSESAIWSFTTRNFAPPTHSVNPVDGVTPTGENNMLTVRRLITAARNRIYYEDT